MKVLIVNGSPRGKGSNTKILTDLFLKGMKDADEKVEAEELTLSQMRIESCKGCFGCWNNPERACVIGDEMTEALERYKKADVVIWSTPVYYHSFTALMKTFIERTLPMASPLILHDGEKYTHPPVDQAMEDKKHILVSTCGFPEYHNFDLIQKDLYRIFERNLDAKVLCVMGELLKEKSLDSIINWYLQGVEQAGYEYMSKGKVTREIEKLLEKPLMNIKTFIDMANVSWKGLELEEGKEVIRKKAKGEGHIYLSQMKYVYNKSNGYGLRKNIGFRFSDTGEEGGFLIDGDSIEVYEGTIEQADLRIITSLDTWKKISNNEIDGANALMEGMYKVEGDMSLMMKFDRLFGEGEREIPEDKCLEDSFYGIKGSKWMGMAFIPWMISWNLGGMNTVFAGAIPLLLAFILLVLKKRVKAVTYFESSTFLYFLVIYALSFLNLFDIREMIAHFNSFGMGMIWISSLFCNKSLTAEYSIYDQEEDLAENIIFNRTNEILTLFWGVLFLVQGSAVYILDANNLGRWGMLMIIPFVLAMKFTNFFSAWYPEYVLKSGKWFGKSV